MEDAIREVREFRDERSWKQYHNPKDLAISINLEAAELLELFQWTGADVSADDKKEEMKDELADILVYCIQLADLLDVDMSEIIKNKMVKNRLKYPVEKMDE